MKKNKIELLFKILGTLSLVGVLLFYIHKDIEGLKSAMLGNSLMRDLQTQREKVKFKAMTITVNHYRPDLSLWKGFLLYNTPPDKRFLGDCVQYYEIISGYIPQVSESWHLAGVCHQLLGEQGAAVASFEKAVAVEPRLFWAWYDLGQIYYEQGRFEKSVDAFKKALVIPPGGSFQFFHASMLFREIERSVPDPSLQDPARLKEAYREAGRMLEVSIRRMHGVLPASTPVRRE